MNERLKQQAGALTDWEAMRDAVLNERGSLAEAGLDSDQINAVLGVIDNYIPAQRTPATASAPQSTERMHGAAEIERAMRDTPELGNPARNYKDVDRLIKRVLARLSAREQPSKEQPVI